MRVMVTGASGFIGSNLIPKLLAMGAEVHSVERYVAGRFGKLDSQVIRHFAELRDYPALVQEVKNIQPEVVIHLAALSPVAYSFDHPTEVLETNWLASLQLAEACRKNVPDLAHFISAGTSEEYGVTTLRPATEDSPCVPNSPYSCAKLASTQYFMYLLKAYDFPVTVMRCTNTYGRKNDAHFFVERAILQMLKNKDGEVYLGDPDPVRDFMYVDDHVEAYLNVLRNREKTIGQIFNFATGRTLKVQEVADKIGDLSGFKGKIVWHSIPRRPLDIMNHTLSTAKAKSLLGWEAKVPLEQGLKRTIGVWQDILSHGQTIRMN